MHLRRDRKLFIGTMIGDLAAKVTGEDDIQKRELAKLKAESLKQTQMNYQRIVDYSVMCGDLQVFMSKIIKEMTGIESSSLQKIEEIKQVINGYSIRTAFKFKQLNNP